MLSRGTQSWWIVELDPLPRCFPFPVLHEGGLPGVAPTEEHGPGKDEEPEVDGGHRGQDDEEKNPGPPACRARDLALLRHRFLPPRSSRPYAQNTRPRTPAQLSAMKMIAPVVISFSRLLQSVPSTPLSRPGASG